MRLPHWLDSKVTVLVAFFFALTANAAVLVVGAVVHHEGNAYQVCEAQYQQDFAQGYRARYVVAKAVSHAMDKIVKAVADEDSKELHMAVANYQTLRNIQRTTRATHPLPKLPAKVCGAAKDAGQ